MIGHAMGGPGPAFPGSTQIRPPLMTMEHSDATNLSAVEVYRQQHEVTATVCSLFFVLSMFLMRCKNIFLSNIVYHLVS